LLLEPQTPHVTEQSHIEKEKEMSTRAHLHPLVAVAIGLGLAWLGLQPAAAANFTVGFAVVETTPTPTNGYTRALSGVSLGGYGLSCPLFGLGRRAPAGIHDKLYARALAIESGGTSFVLVMLDAIGAGNRTTAAIQQQASQALGLPAEHIFVGESHSHAAPDLVGLWSQFNAVHHPDFTAYRDFVIAKAVTAIQTAWQQRQAADLYVATGSLDRAVNRRGWGFTDPALVVLYADTASLPPTRIATLVSWAAHPTVLPAANRQLSRDFPGSAVDALEAILGAGTVVYWNGALGDASPAVPSRDFASAQELGRAVATATLAAMQTPKPTRVGPGIHLARQSFVTCVTNPSFVAALTLGCLDYALVAPPAGCVSQQAVGSAVAYIRLGTEVQIALTPGEALTRLAIGDAMVTGVKDAMTDTTHHLWLNPSPDFLGYLIPCDEYNDSPPGDDAYEEGVSLGTCADGWITQPLQGLIVNDEFPH
jgi:hypothetical protein